MTVKDYLSSDVLTKNKNYEIGHNAKEIKKVCDEGKMGELIVLKTDYNEEYEEDEKYF